MGASGGSERGSSASRASVSARAHMLGHLGRSFRLAHTAARNVPPALVSPHAAVLSSPPVTLTSTLASGTAQRPLDQLPHDAGSAPLALLHIQPTLAHYQPNVEQSLTQPVLSQIAAMQPGGASVAGDFQLDFHTPAETLELSSVVKKRRKKMNKHRHRKRLKKTRTLRKQLGKI